jgi:hypothetical protein
VVVATPSTPTKLSNFSVQIVGNPASNWPTSVTVQVVVNGNANSSVFCSINSGPSATNACTSSGSTILPANGNYALEFTVANSSLVNPAWDQFDISVGYTTTLS